MKTKDSRPYVDFYKQHKISPVAQDISDLAKHYERREYLYRRLGIIASFVRGRTVIEFGPGSGHNALFTYSLGPSRYVLVDGNPTGLAECAALLSRYFGGEQRYELVESLIEEFVSDEQFDLVICEGLIPAQKDPKQFARNVASFTKPSGACIVTCHDPVGMFTDLLRCLIGTIVAGDDLAIETKVEVLVNVFGKHLDTLKGMSRPHRDWVVDQIINKVLWRDSNLFSVADAIAALDPEFDVYGVSPFFFTDWRWYKDVHGEGRGFNDLGKECYLKNIHNFLDCRFEFEARPAEANARLLRHCADAWRLIVRFGHERDKRYIEGICRETAGLASSVKTFAPVTAQALEDFTRRIEKYPAIDAKTDWGAFASWWGRGMQYLSFIRGR